MTSNPPSAFRQRRRAPALAALLLLLGIGPAAAPAPAGGMEQQEGAPPAGPTAALVTVGRGSAVWERFGHNLIWIRDPETGTSEAYNYGLFSFDQEGFLARFIRGKMRYWMAGRDAGSTLRAYARQDRTIWIQELALDTAEVRELHAFLEWNERPENRFYRYQYYRDNCSTRIRDVLDDVLGGALREWARDRPTDLTYRDHTLRVTEGIFWAQIGLHLGMGPPTDRPLTAWEAMFIPMEMRDWIRDFRRDDGAGGTAPLVRSERVLHRAARPPAPAETPRWIPGSLVAGLLGGGLLVGLGLWAGRGRTGRTALAAVGVPWLLLPGIAGLLLTFMWGFTDHVDAHGNANLFHANPLHLLAAVTLGLGLSGTAWARRMTAWIAGAAGAVSLLGFALELVPFPDQVNAEFVALLLPANLALAWVAWRLDPGRGGSPGGEIGGG